MKRSVLSVIVFFLFVCSSSSQDLLIRYDIVNKNVSFFRIRKTKDGQKLIPIEKPRVGPNKNIRVEYVNMNPYIWNQPKMNVVTVAQDSVSSFNPFSMMLPTNITDRFGSLSLSLTRDAATATPQQVKCESSLRSLYSAYDEIDRLKYNYKLTKQQILDQSAAKIRQVMKTCNTSPRADTAAPGFTKSDFETLREYFKDLCHIDLPPATRAAGTSATDAFLGQAGITSGNRIVLPAEAVTDIEKDYFTIAGADFSYENSFIVSDKDVVVNMDFSVTNDFRKKTAKDSVSASGSPKPPQKVKGESIFIPVSGGVRISSSAGIGFTYLGNARKTYYLEGDSILAATPDNRVVPVVGTFINAYSRGLGAVNLGGSFGLCVALQETLSMNYMFGMTTVFGRKEKLLVSFGCVLAPVEEPSKGYHEGMVTTNANFPTSLNYKPGIFFCVHYNVGKF